MKKKETHKENFDQQIKGLFDGFQQEPNSMNWEKIQHSLEAQEEEQDFDSIFKQKFAQSEPPPPPQVWEKVKKELPLHLIVRTQLSKLSKIAAALLFVMISFATYDHFNESGHTADLIPKEQDPLELHEKDLIEKGIVKGLVFETQPEEEESFSNDDFEEFNFANEEARKEFAAKMLSKLMEQDDSIDQNIDTLKLSHLLKPATNLLDETSYTSLKDEIILEEEDDSNQVQMIPPVSFKAAKRKFKNKLFKVL